MQGYQTQLDKISEDLTVVENKIIEKTIELTSLIRELSKRNAGLGVLSALVPFIGAIISSSVKTAKNPEDQAKIKALETEIMTLVSDKNLLKQQAFTLEMKLVDVRMTEAKATFDLGKNHFTQF